VSSSPTPLGIVIALAATVAGTTVLKTRIAAPAPEAQPLVVGADLVATHLRDPNLVLLHVGDRAEYDRAHLPGARFVSQRDLSVSDHDHARDAGLALEMPAPDSLRTLLARLGISDDSRIVVYYGGDWVSPATRIVFTLDYAGLGARTSLLDGGMRRWIAAGQPTTTDVPAPRAGTLKPLAIQPLVVDAAWVQARLGRRGVSVVDGRARSFYDGVERTGPRAGRIPGARSVPFTELADDSLRLRTPAELAALFVQAGVQRGDTIVGYCHIGQQATATLFAARLAGHPVRLYDGSMQEWSRRTELPVEAR
jgi:thiosulfate/3-mercaptopyruvate sulfurtransferase